MFVHGIVGFQNLIEGLHLGLYILGFTFWVQMYIQMLILRACLVEISWPEISGTLTQLPYNSVTPTSCNNGASMLITIAIFM